MADYKHILAATDFSESSRAAVRQAAAVARRFNARLTLLHVLEHFPEDEPTDLIPPEDVDPAEFQRQRRQAKLVELTKEIGFEDAELKVISTTHSARHGLEQFVETHAIDLMVLGSHESLAFMNWLTTSPDDLVKSPPCDVLVVHSSP
jgi:universal stress protein A